MWNVKIEYAGWIREGDRLSMVHGVDCLANGFGFEGLGPASGIYRPTLGLLQTDNSHYQVSADIADYKLTDRTTLHSGRIREGDRLSMVQGVDVSGLRLQVEPESQPLSLSLPLSPSLPLFLSFALYFSLCLSSLSPSLSPSLPLPLFLSLGRGTGFRWCRGSTWAASASRTNPNSERRNIKHQAQ